MSLRVYSKTIPKGFKSPQLEAALRNFGKLPALLGKIGSVLTGEIKRNLGGRILQRRSGRLQDSWDWEVTAKNAGWELAISSEGVPYARIQNFGGWTGKGHRTRIPRSRYVDRAVIAKKALVRRVLRDYITKIWYR